MHHTNLCSTRLFFISLEVCIVLALSVFAFSIHADSYLRFPYMRFPSLPNSMFRTCLFRTCVFQYLRFQRPRRGRGQKYRERGWSSWMRGNQPLPPDRGAGGAVSSPAVYGVEPRPLKGSLVHPRGTRRPTVPTSGAWPTCSPHKSSYEMYCLLLSAVGHLAWRGKQLLTKN